MQTVENSQVNFWSQNEIWVQSFSKSKRLIFTRSIVAQSFQLFANHYMKVAFFASASSWLVVWFDFRLEKRRESHKGDYAIRN